MVTEKNLISKKSRLFAKAFNKKKILIFFIIWSIWLSLEFLLGAFSHVRIHDSGDSLLPQLIASKIQFEKYGISYFADYMVSGVDASSQSLSPFSNINSLLFIIFPGWFAYGLLMFTQRFLASYFTYRLARDSLKLNIYPAIIAGLLFSLFSFSIYSFTLYHALGIPALAFIIWVLEKISLKNSPKRYFYLIAFGSFVGYTNYFVYFSPYLLPFIFLWFIFIRPTNNIKTIINLILFSLFTMLLMFPNIVAILYNSQFSHRTVFNLYSEGFYPQGRYLSTLYKLFSIFTSYWPSFLILIFPLLKFKFNKRLGDKLLITLVFSTFIPIFYKLIQSGLSRLPPIIKSFSFDRFELLIPFTLALTVASFLNLYSKQKLKKVFIFSIALIMVVSFKVKIETVKNYAPYRSLYQHPDLIELSKNIDSSQWRVATVTGGGARPSYALANGLYTVDAYLTLYPSTYHTFWSNVIKDRISNDKSRYEDFMDWGNRVYLYGPNDFDSLERINFEKYYNLDLLSQANVKYIISTKPIDDPNLILQNSQYRQDVSQWAQWMLSKKIVYFLKGKYYGRPYYIYKNIKALPRFYLIADREILADSVKIRSYSPDKIELETNQSQSTELILNINYYPWWKVTINGYRVSIGNYEGTFMSFEIPKGDNQIILEYLPPYKI